MDRFAAMRAFVEIVDRGSLTAAAEALDRSQPAMVRTLAALEQHLGVALLRRTTRRSSLTTEGRDYLERCRRILADVEEAERALGQEQDELRGPLTVTAPVEFGRIHVAPAVAEFLEQHARVRIDLLLLDRVVDLVEEGIDLALRIGPLADSSMVAVQVGSVRNVVVASPELLRKTGRPRHPRALADLPCIRQQNLQRSETVWPFAEQGRNLIVKVDGRFGCNQIAAAVAACTTGRGFGRFLSYQVEQGIRDGQLALVLEDFEPPPWPVNLVYPGGRLVSSRQRALLNWLKDRLRRDV